MRWLLSVGPALRTPSGQGLRLYEWLVRCRGRQEETWPLPSPLGALIC